MGGNTGDILDGEEQIASTRSPSTPGGWLVVEAALRIHRFREEDKLRLTLDAYLPIISTPLDDLGEAGV